MSWGVEKDKCDERASEEHIRIGLGVCSSGWSDEIKRETNWYNRSKEYKCAKKAFKKPPKSGVGISYRTCMGFD